MTNNVIVIHGGSDCIKVNPHENWSSIQFYEYFDVYVLNFIAPLLFCFASL